MRRLALLQKPLPAAALLASFLLAGGAFAQSPPAAPAAPAKAPAQAPSAAPAKPPAQPASTAPAAPPAASTAQSPPGDPVSPPAQSPPGDPSAQPPSPGERPPPDGLEPAPLPVSQKPKDPPPAYLASLAKGQKLLEAGRHLEAAHELATALRGAMSDGLAPRELPYYVASLLQQARSKIGVLTISSDKDREIEVDGIAVGKSPIVGEILLAPGQHRVLSRGDICLGKVDFDIKAGEARRIKVPCSQAPAWRIPSMVIGAVGTGLSLSVATILLATSEGRAGQINSAVQTARAQGYVEPWSLSTVQEAERSRVDLLNTSITAFLVSGALLAATATVSFAVKPRRPDEPAPLVGLSAGPGHAGVWMRW